MLILIYLFIISDTSLDAQIGLLTTAQYLIVFGSVILGIIIISHLRILSFVIMSMRASKNLHNTIYERLIIAVMRFFDTNPSGNLYSLINIILKLLCNAYGDYLKFKSMKQSQSSFGSLTKMLLVCLLLRMKLARH